MSRSTKPSGIFGRRSEPHTIIIAQGERIRHVTLGPWTMAAVGTVAVAFGTGYLLATSYLVFRDDLIGASIARQARMQHAYEDRISALRSQVDRIISRQLLDQELMEQKVAQLMQRQDALLARNAKLGPLLERAGGAAAHDGGVPVPSARPDAKVQASLLDFTTTGTVSAGTGYQAADLADQTFMSITTSLKAVEGNQIERLQGLILEADQTGRTIASALQGAGLPISDIAEEGVGGPFIPAADAPTAFDKTVEALDDALLRLDSIRTQANRYPIFAPLAGHAVSSSFGYRKDPLLGTRAFHSGMDFRAPTGVAVKAAAAGTVTHADWNGGYGRLVEVRHAAGWTSRYAHLSAISVTVGDVVQPGDKIGEVGSSGRSTGPHLHFEVRQSDTPKDPAPFLKTGRKIAELM
jgi:murein DD-endopeptidase MepM/ murein hydrolase activator NlpD